ncbi:aminodeoxychorismate lyase family protein [endosymbiont of Acanthamoeba sp. UWC8]|uniref:endolytic transglycosylase MltG n=1 Tax=endosymbiont of Acanthamoeba sp. UWC8 TaxID=86106 RepID=UPI0004D1789E|nr:endolytic transglycosylase MltG [endosymbiont of Acanthamoeba sp. UWC8]AIF80620.1 aminodeoxychorismate lyase family protein [endosymbiont of Acanthamoeba sp. UWC8]
MLSKLKKFFIIYLIFKLLLIVAVVYSYHDTFYKTHVYQEKIVIIPKNYSINQIADLLHKKEVIKSQFLFILLSKAHSFKKQYLQSGEYKFEAGMKMIEVIHKLTRGEVIIHKVTVPEGLTNSQVFKILDNSYGLRGSINKEKYKEGYLLPETYSYTYGTPKDSILARMHADMEKHLNLFIATAVLPVPLKDVNELLALASIVEKESSINAEKPLVAGVYLNRLRINMPLQADPTVIYGMTGGVEPFPKRLNYKDLESDSLYNTYKVKGLPPTPIANPGLRSIAAVLHPANTKDLFFVADGLGGHKFSETYKEHLTNVKNFRTFTGKKPE